MTKLLIAVVSLVFLSGLDAARADELDPFSVKLFQAQLALAEQGRPQAQYYLAEMHLQGLGTKQDVDQAMVWYAKAAAQGLAEARRKLEQKEALRRQVLQERELERQKQEQYDKALAAERARLETQQATAQPAAMPSPAQLRARTNAAEQEELKRKLKAFQEAMAREKARMEFSSGF
jgi:septal ring factor EnvC (AmiA/AmiB activator)